MKRFATLRFALASLLISVGASARATDAPTPALTTPAENDPAALEFFEKKVRPLLASNCYNCHSANNNSRGGLRVDDLNGLLRGGERGAAIIPGQPDQSLLIAAVKQTGELKMPPDKQLSESEIADLSQWIASGAVWPKPKLPEEITAPKPEYAELIAKHWAWQPLSSPQLPVVRNTAWVRNDIDRFVLAALEAQGLTPVVDADKLHLVRRVTYDLTGLPPTPAEVDAFLYDASPDAYPRLVDRLLASPAFGERWGRHWLDVARYGESTGSSRNLPYPQAWRYRDYVIDAVNADKPYDQFIREQIAGDLLPADTPERRDEQLIATGFLALGVKDVNQRFKVRFVMDNIDEQIDTVSRSVLALTASCARCHDHKFDPIPTTDYYALAGIFHSTDLCAGVRNKMGGGGLDYYDSKALLHVGPPVEPDPALLAKIEETRVQVKEAQAAFQAFKGKPEGNEPSEDGRPKRAVARQKWNKLAAELMAMEEEATSAGRATLGVRDAQAIGDTEIRIRGEAEQLGPQVPRGFLSLLPLASQPGIPANQSGRLELAQWLTSPENPLTPRVAVNRVWKHLFGEGLVRSVDNFGVTGDSPSHPELLDHLAGGFVRDGWSLKRLVRRLVLSRAYQLSSQESPANAAIDPEARLVWRHNPRRLAAEELRDTILAVSGALDRSRPDGSPAQELRVIEMRNNGAEARRLVQAALASRYRSVYLPLVRDVTPTILEVFDFAEQGMVTGDRDTTTVPAQALFLLNDPLVRKQSLALADRLLAGQPVESDSAKDAARIDQVYRISLGRAATPAEVDRAREYLTAYAAEYAAIGPPAPPTTAPAPEPAAVAASESTPKKKVVDPDQVVEEAAPEVEETITFAHPQQAAWASFCQALFGSAEFRYLK